MRKHNRPKEFRQSESEDNARGGAERQTVRRERRLDGAGGTF